MLPIELGPARPIGAIDNKLARKPGGEDIGQAQSRPPLQRTPGQPVVKSAALDPGPEPVDAERVKIIRDAVENGTYPIVPARIADAMIAAGFLLRSGQ